MSDFSTRRSMAAWHWRHWLLATLLAAPGWALAQSYIGRVCLVSTITTRQTGPVAPQVMTMQLDVTNLGGTTYAVSGWLPNADEPFVVAGQATVIGGELYFNMTTTQRHASGWMDTGVNQTRLNLSTMTGTFYEIGHDFDTVGRTFDTARYTAGTVSLSLSACR